MLRRRPPVPPPRTIRRSDHGPAARDAALNAIERDFPLISVRIVVSIFCGYLEQYDALDTVVDATRARLLDACTAA